jgi:hypothetical protein
MDKRLLSQLLDDSAFPLLVLAMAVSQLKLGPLRRPHLRGKGPSPSIEFQSHERSLKTPARHPSIWRSPVSHSIRSNELFDHYE